MIDPLIGCQLGGCQIQSVIGRGGMATVYRAYQPGLGRHVALKVLPPTLAADPHFVERFRREALATARLRHPNIVQVLSAGNELGYHYIVMEICEGGTLAERLGQRVLSPEAAVTILRPIADGLDYAHAAGLIHRDIKPSNILFTKDGQPVITDFGIARILQASSITFTRGFLGSPEYVSPEQVQGRHVDARSDVYSLGVILYQLLTGAVPFTGEQTAILYAHVHTPPPPPHTVRPGLDPGVEKVVLRALAKDPAQRYGSAGEMVRALAAAAGVDAQAPVAGRSPVPAIPTAGKRPAWLWGLAAVPLALLLGAALLSAQSGGRAVAPATPTRPAAVAAVSATSTRATAPTSIPAAATAAPVATASSASKTTAQPAPAATATRPAPTATGVAPAPTATKAVPAPTATAAPPAPVATSAPPAPPAAGRPSGGRIAFTEYYGAGPRQPGSYDIYIANVDGSGRTKLLSRSSEPVFSPDGRRLAFYSWDEGGVFVVNSDGSGRQRISPHGNDAWPTWSPNQATIAYAAMRGTCTWWDVFAGTCNPRFDIYSIPIGGKNETNIVDGEQPSWGPDGRLVYKGCLGSNCGLMVVTPNGQGKTRITTHANDSNPVWSHSNGQIVFSSDRSGNWDIWRVNADGGGLVQLTKAPGNDGTPTWSVDGQWIYFRSDRNNEWAVWAMKPDGSDQVRLFASRVSDRWWWERVSAGR